MIEALNATGSSCFGVSNAKERLLQALADYFRELLATGDPVQRAGFHGSDVRLADAEASNPGASGSAAPMAADLSGETSRHVRDLCRQRQLLNLHAVSDPPTEASAGTGKASDAIALGRMPWVPLAPAPRSSRLEPGVWPAREGRPTKPEKPL